MTMGVLHENEGVPLSLTVANWPASIVPCGGIGVQVFSFLDV